MLLGNEIAAGRVVWLQCIGIHTTMECGIDATDDKMIPNKMICLIINQ